MTVLPKLYGHKEKLDFLKKSFSSQRFPHAWVFSGPRGIGKFLTAQHLAHHIFSQNDNPDSVSRKMLAGAYPDLLVVERTPNDKGELKANIAADEIRKINEYVQQTTLAQKWRIIIVDDANLMNRHAANALLKVLEDPPKFTVFILIAHSKSDLLPTILSRSQVLTFSPLSQNEFAKVLDTDLDTASDLYDLCDGVPGEARQMMDPELLDAHRGLQRRLQNLGSSTDMHDLYGSLKKKVRVSFKNPNLIGGEAIER